LTQDFNLLYSTATEEQRDKFPWDLSIKLNGFLENVISTLFGQKYQTMILDEGHEFRNVGPKHMAAFNIMTLATVRLVMTATPLQTSTKVGYITNVHYTYSFFVQDIAAMGRLIHIPFFLMKGSIDKEKQDMASIRHTRSSLPLCYDPLNDDDDDPIKICYTTIAQRMQDQFEGHILCHTVISVAWKGNPLIKLKPYLTIMVKLRLGDHEMEILDHLAAKVHKM